MGRSLYREAVEIANQNDKSGFAIRALVSLAREEINARTPLARRSALENAEQEFDKFTSIELSVLLDHLRDVIERVGPSEPSKGESTKRRVQE